MKSIDIETFSTEAVPIKAILNTLVSTDETIALTENGETIYTVAKGAVKKLSPSDYPREAVQDKSKRVPGTAKGQIWIASDFDELPEDISHALGISD